MTDNTNPSQLRRDQMDTPKMRHSLALDIDIPEGYTLTGLEMASARGGYYSTAKIRKGGARGPVIGDITDEGNGGGCWPTVYGDEREPFMEWLKNVPSLWADEEWHGGEWSEEDSANTLLLELEVLRSLKKAARGGTPFIVGDGNPADSDLRILNTKDQDVLLPYLRREFASQRVRVWNPTDGWQEVTA